MSYMLILLVENLTEADIPSSVNLDGEPLTDAELRELERMERVYLYFSFILRAI